VRLDISKNKTLLSALDILFSILLGFRLCLHVALQRFLRPPARFLGVGPREPERGPSPSFIRQQPSARCVPRAPRFGRRVTARPSVLRITSTPHSINSAKPVRYGTYSSKYICSSFTSRHTWLSSFRHDCMTAKSLDYD
jgi:hypothetical protein